MSVEIKIPRKLIEVALPLDIINKACAREKSIRHGHPSTLHLWWARRPLAAARAVIFAQMVNDPGYERHLGRGMNKEAASIERERLFGIIERLVQWENTSNQAVIKEARIEIEKSWKETCALNREHPQAAILFDPNKLPAFHDPFAGGGAIPLEAQRLGLETYASDLNPVAVVINKAMIEIPSRFISNRPVGPIPENDEEKFSLDFEGSNGLAEDVRRYGSWMRSEAIKRIGHNYPSVEINSQIIKLRPELKPLLGEKLMVIAWIWTRTVRSPNPAFSHVDVPLVSTFVLSSKKGNEAYIEPIITGDKYRFEIRTGIAPAKFEAGTVERSGGHCLISGAPMPFTYLREEGKAKRLGVRLMAIVVEGPKGRIYIDPLESHEQVVTNLSPSWRPDTEICHWPGRTNVVEYGMTTFGDLFTERQLTAINMFTVLIKEVREKCRKDALAAGVADNSVGIADGGVGATAYAEAVATYLAFAVDKGTNYWSSLCAWSTSTQKMISTFGRQALPMVWDFTEANPFSDSSGNFKGGVEQACKFLKTSACAGVGFATQEDAAVQSTSTNKIVSIDPPYYDNIGYADLSDFFYVWLKKSIGDYYPKLLGEKATPKIDELIASPYRHGGKLAAESFFLAGMTNAIKRLAESAHPAFPISIFYAFKQSETKQQLTTNTGWETFLEAVIASGYAITGTWPMRTEYTGNLKKEMNSLASSVVLTCKIRNRNAQTISRRDFVRELNATLPGALLDMTTAGGRTLVAPVDLSQAIIGPGMAIFSKYAAVLEADGQPMSVRTALQLINRFFAEDDFDHDTQFCVHWFEAHGWEKGRFGEADVLARAKGTSVDGLRNGGVIESSSGNLRLLKPDEFSESWRIEADSRVSVWEILHQMIARFVGNGETGAGEVLARAGQLSESIRTLAYRLYTLCERKSWSLDAGTYDSLIRAWDSIELAARSAGYTGTQISLFGETQSNEGEPTVPKKKTRKKKQ